MTVMMARISVRIVIPAGERERKGGEIKGKIKLSLTNETNFLHAASISSCRWRD